MKKLPELEKNTMISYNELKSLCGVKKFNLALKPCKIERIIERPVFVDGEITGETEQVPFKEAFPYQIAFKANGRDEAICFIPENKANTILEVGDITVLTSCDFKYLSTSDALDGGKTVKVSLSDINLLTGEA